MNWRGMLALWRRRVPRAVATRYLALLAIMNIGWEFAQMPLYTIGQTGTWTEIAFAGLHCALGDVMIGATSLVAALLMVGSEDWPAQRSLGVLTAATALGLAYTIFSEWLNVEVRHAWSYSEAMPRLPVLGTGLSPLLQWIIVPPAAYLTAASGYGSRGWGNAIPIRAPACSRRRSS